MQISNLMIKDKGSAEYVNINLQIVVLLIPLVCLQGGLYGIIRAVDRQKVFLYCQLVCNYGVHFGSMAIFLVVFKMDSRGMWWARFCSLVSLDVCAVVIIMASDWEERYREIQKSI